MVLSSSFVYNSWGDKELKHQEDNLTTEDLDS